jgi:superfamily II DNA or RNA helicase
MSGLYPDQLKALTDYDAAITAGARSPIIAAATAFGKTRTAAHRMGEIAAAGGRAWFMAHLGELLEDTAARLEASGIRYGWIWGNRPQDPGAPCQLVSVATAARRLDALGPPPDLAVIDEVHRATSPSYQLTLDALGRPRVMGLTGTPLRTDGRPMRAGGFDALIRTPDTIDLINAGRLSPLCAWSFPEPSELSRLGFRGRDFDQVAAGEIMSDGAILGDALEHWEERCRTAGATRPTVIFTSSVRQAQETAEAWRRAGFRAMAVSGDSPPQERRNALAWMRGGDLDALVCADLYVAGLDLPDLGAVVCLRKTDSLIVWLQMVGRGLRRSSAWPDCYLLDHVGNCRRPGLGDPLARRMHLWSLDDGCGRRVREAVPPVAVCEACYSTAMVGRRCLDCGHEREAPKVRDVVLLPGQLAEFPVGQDERRQRREQEEQERKERTQARKAEERACWNPADPSGTLARFVALAKMRQAESGKDVDPMRALRWAHLQISFRNGSRYPQHRQPVARVRRARA